MNAVEMQPFAELELIASQGGRLSDVQACSVLARILRRGDGQELELVSAVVRATGRAVDPPVTCSHSPEGCEHYDGGPGE